jgi:hypothetical protein
MRDMCICCTQRNLVEGGERRWGGDGKERGKVSVEGGERKGGEREREKVGGWKRKGEGLRKG